MLVGTLIAWDGARSRCTATAHAVKCWTVAGLSHASAAAADRLGHAVHMFSFFALLGVLFTVNVFDDDESVTVVACVT
jgi:hypothetical protein